MNNKFESASTVTKKVGDWKKEKTAGIKSQRETECAEKLQKNGMDKTRPIKIWREAPNLSQYIYVFFIAW